MFIPTHPTYSQLHDDCTDLCRLMGPADLIIGLSRGGLLPGVICSHLLDIPFKPLDYSSKRGQGDKMNSNHIPPWIAENYVPTRVHLLDDIVDSGHTIAEVYRILTENNFCVNVVSVYYKESAVFTPHLYKYKIPHDFGWIVFPFERR